MKTLSGLDFGKKPWSQLAPEILDLVASANILVAKKFSTLRAKDFYSKISFDTIAFIAYHLA